MTGLKRSGPLTRTTELRSVTPLARSAPLRSVPPSPRTPREGRPLAVVPSRTVRRDTGFTVETRLMIRTRAGNGNPEEARCEATGVFLGLHGGELQHRRARGRGGSRDPLTNTTANAVLLASPVHALAETRDERMHAEGFWLNSWQSPLHEPILLHGADGGITVWLDADGNYLTEDPRGGAA